MIKTIVECVTIANIQKSSLKEQEYLKTIINAVLNTHERFEINHIVNFRLGKKESAHQELWS